MLDYLKKKVISTLVVIGLVWLGVFLLLFSNDETPLYFIVLASFGFGLISGVIVLFYQLLYFKLSLPNNNILLTIVFTSVIFLSIAIANYLFLLFLEQSNPSWDGFLGLFGITILIGVFPVLGMFFYEKNQKLSSQLKKARPIIDHLSTGVSKSSTRWTIKLNKSDSRNINVDSLLFVESQKNYLTFHFDENKSFQIRFTLKQLEESFKDFDFLIRCHRSFLINGNKIESIAPTSNGYQIFLSSWNTSVPVSKTYTSALKKWANSSGAISF